MSVVGLSGTEIYLNYPMDWWNEEL